MRAPDSSNAPNAGVVVPHPVAHAREVVQRLLRHEKPTPADIERAIGDEGASRPVDRHVLRHVLVDELTSGFLMGKLAERIEAAFVHLGLGRQRDRLVAIAADRDRGVRLRSVALQILAAAGGGLEAVLGDEGPWVNGAIVDLGLRAALLNLVSHPELEGRTIGDLAALPPPMRERAFADMEDFRRAAGIPAALVYGHLIAARVWEEQRDGMIAAIVDEGDAAAVDLLTRLRDAEKEPKARRALGRAVLALRTRRLDPIAPPIPEGEAALTVPDHKGSATLRVRLDNPDDSVTWILCEIDPALGLTEATVIAAEPRAQAEERAGLLQIVGIYGQTPVGLGQAARIARDAAAVAAAQAARADASIDAALFLLDRIPAEDIPAIEPATSLPVEEIRDLIDHVRYVSLKLPEVVEALPERERPELPVERWLRKTAAAVARPDLQARLSAILRFMATWHALADEPEEAALAAGVAAATERDFRASPLVHALILEELDGRRFRTRPVRGRDFVEDEATRRRLRERFFGDLGDPRRSDVERLDLTEVVYWTLEIALERASLKVGDDPRERAAYALATAYLSFGEWPLRSIQRRKREEALLKEMAEVASRELGIDGARAEPIAALVVKDLTVFTAQVCSQCPFFCSVNGDEEAEDMLDWEGHPSDV